MKNEYNIAAYGIITSNFKKPTSGTIYQEFCMYLSCFDGWHHLKSAYIQEPIGKMGFNSIFFGAKLRIEVRLSFRLNSSKIEIWLGLGALAPQCIW
jgi:hypothetical protein